MFANLRIRTYFGNLVIATVFYVLSDENVSVLVENRYNTMMNLKKADSHE